MAAASSERLFSLELLVDSVRLEPWRPPPVVSEEEQPEQAEAASAPDPARAACLAVAFRLLDFPTLLVYPPGGPAASAPELRPGLLSFGRGKACLFRLHPATLRRLLLQTPLYALLLQLPPGRPTPAPQLLGTCSISLATAVGRVLCPAAATCSQAHRGSFPLLNQMGERAGDIVLSYRLTDLGSSLLGHLQRPVTSRGGGIEGAELRKATEVSSQTQQEKQRLPQPASEPSPRPADADRPLAGLENPRPQKDFKKVVFHGETNYENTGSVEKGQINSVCSDVSQVRSGSPPHGEVPELDIESNIYCPPPLYYTHPTQGKSPPVQAEITIKPQMNVPEESNGTFPEEKLINLPTHVNPLKHTNSAACESLPRFINPPPVQEIEASTQTTNHPPDEQNIINTIRQLPLLNALLVELSLLNNQPMANPTQIHPHLAWLYRAEDKKSPESYAKSTFKSESKKMGGSRGENEKSVSLPYKRNQVENSKTGVRSEKNSDAPPKRVARGKLLYGITNTLKLRLKQTNPGMLVVHEKREEYRKIQAQMMGAKLRIPSSKVKVFSFAKQHQKSHQLPRDKYLKSDAAFAEDSDTSKQGGRVFNDLGAIKGTKLNCATEETVDCGKNRTSKGTLEDLSPFNSTVPEKFAHTDILEGKVEREAQSSCVFQQVAVVDRNVVVKEIDDRQVKNTDNDILTSDMNENKSSKNSCSEGISELKYSDDFTSPCCSEDFSTTEDISRILQAHDSSAGEQSPKQSPSKTSKSSGTRWSTRKHSSEKSSLLSPPFSAGSPVRSYNYLRSHILKTPNDSLEEAPSISTSDLSSSHWTEEKENQIDQYSIHNYKVLKRGQDISIKLKTRTGGKSLEKIQSPRTSQVSSYLPSNLSELEVNVLDSSASDHLEEDNDEVGSLSISKQYKDISELVINKLPGYTV